MTNIRRSSEYNLEGYLSEPEEIEIPTTNNEVAYGYYYPPVNKDYEAPEATAPPLLVRMHGGPTREPTRRWSFPYSFTRGRTSLQLENGLLSVWSLNVLARVVVSPWFVSAGDLGCWMWTTVARADMEGSSGSSSTWSKSRKFWSIFRMVRRCKWSVECRKAVRVQLTFTISVDVFWLEKIFLPWASSYTMRYRRIMFVGEGKPIFIWF